MKIEASAEVLQSKKLFLATPMYGGLCSGMYTKSVSDLTALSTRYGISLVQYFLFNESLIPRARNYCVDEFLRSSCTHFLFIDADIGFDANDVIAMLILQDDTNDYDILSAPYPKKSYPKHQEIITDIGLKSFGWLVDHRYDGKALTIDNDGNFVWGNITNWFRDKETRRWVKVRTTATNTSNFECTFDHEVYGISDILNPTPSYIEAHDTVGKYIVATPHKRRNRLYNAEQMQALYGMLLGDGCISKNRNAMTIGHGVVQEQYVDFIRGVLGGHKRLVDSYKGSYSTKKQIHLLVPGSQQTKKLRKLAYDDNGIKRCGNILPLLNDIGVAFWYMDDGCLKHTADTYYCEFNTQGFGDEEQHEIVSFFKEKYGINPKIDICWRDFKRIRLSKLDTEILHQKIAPFVDTSMEYKIIPSFRNGIKHSYNNTPLNFSACEVGSVETIGSYEESYNITVEPFNRLVLKGGLVNKQCISWEKVVAAVNQGKADDNPEELSKYIGDYVFNPKDGSNQIKIDEPAQVLEAGTGFMMIRRKTLEKFQEAYPQYMYKPDHVRTEHFDGSREITMFFQAEIDPKSKRYLSEDYWFNQKCWDIGIKTWLCPWMKTSHVGTMVFGGSLADLAQIGQHATADLNLLKKQKKT